MLGKIYIITCLSLLILSYIEASRILICVPCPSLSHQVLFYLLITELLNRNHEVIFITTDPVYPEGKAQPNLTEVNTHDASYKAWTEKVLLGTTTGRKSDGYGQVLQMIPIIADSFVLQMQTPEVQDLIKKKSHIDLVIVEGVSKSAQVLSHVFKAPMILMNSYGALQNNYHVIGAPIYPKLLYPIFWHQKLKNMTIMDKVRVMWDTYRIERMYDNFRVQENINVKKLFGPDTPSLEELGNNVDMLFLSVYPIWENNRPVPPGVVYIPGMHQKPQKSLPKDLKAYLDSSEKGVVYFSMGTNVNPSTLPADKIQALINGLAKLSHPNIKAFVTQGGLQSFDEALTAAVPLVGIPMLADQWYNVERYASLKLGVALLMEELTEDILANAINTVIDDPSYKKNMIALRDKIRDQPQSALERAVWWTEHVIRHKGAAHLRAPAANMSWLDYLDVELLTVLTLAVLAALATAAATLYLLLRPVAKFVDKSSKFKVE